MGAFYNTLTLPSFAPPSWLFGPVWTFLYILIAISFTMAVMGVIQKKYSPLALIPLGINLISNFLWTALFFKMQNFGLALADILIVWGSIIVIFGYFWGRARWISYAQIPYFLWVSFATILMFNIWLYN